MNSKPKRLEETWPASKVTLWPIDKIRPYEKNPRLHSDAQIDLIASSMKDDGVIAPILVDEDGVIIYGHGRRLAALKNGFIKYPVSVALGWSDQRKRAVRIKDNSFGELSTWGPQLIAAELQDLKLQGFDIPLLGFPEHQLRGWGISLGTESEQDPEEIPEPPKHPIVRKGDLWILGEHRLLCGDATSKSDVTICLGEATTNLMVTDPPWGVDYDAKWRMVAGLQRPGQKIANGAVLNDTKANWEAAWCLFPGDIAYIWSSDREAFQTLMGIIAAGFHIRAGIIWAKSSITPTRGHYHTQHEPCWYVVREGKTAHWEGGHKQSTLWSIPSMHRTQGNVDDGRTIHSTQKPIECMKRPIENNSAIGEFVYDPFVGSGTTIIAAEMTSRKALTIEIDPSYCQVAIERWQNFTGREATLNGKTLSQVSKARRKTKSSHHGTTDNPIAENIS